MKTTTFTTKNALTFRESGGATAVVNDLLKMKNRNDLLLPEGIKSISERGVAFCDQLIQIKFEFALTGEMCYMLFLNNFNIKTYIVSDNDFLKEEIVFTKETLKVGDQISCLNFTDSKNRSNPRLKVVEIKNRDKEYFYEISDLNFAQLNVEDSFDYALVRPFADTNWDKLLDVNLMIY